MTPAPAILPELLLPLAAGLPLACALAAAARGWRRMMSWVIPFAALPAAAAAALLPDGSRVAYDWVLLRMQLGMDPTGRLFLFFTSLLWLVSGLFGVGYLSADPRRARFFFFFALAMSGNLGLILAQEMVGFYLFFALMSFSAYGLVVHTGTPEALRAGRIYLCLVVVGEISIFAAMVLLAAATGDLVWIGPVPGPHDGTIRWLLFLGFGIKAGALPLHVWLPPAHSTAPTPASAVLSGAMIKAGLLGWLRFLPIAETPDAFWGGFHIIAGMSAAFYAVAVGATQTHPKTILAYSSISQMGLMLVALGTGLAWPQAWEAAAGVLLLFGFHHALNKAALFLGVGVAEGTDSPLQRRLVAAGLLLPALALAGAPFTSGETAKAVLAALDGTSGVSWPAWVAWGVSLSSLGTAVLMARFCFVVRFAVKKADRWATAGIRWVWVSLLALTASGTMLFSRMGASGAADAWYPQSVLSALWPVLAGAGLYVIGRRLLHRSAIALRLRIPAGDVLALIVPVWCALREAWRLCAGKTAGRLAAAAAACRAAAGRVSVFRNAVLRSENRLTRWFAAGAAFLLLAAMWLASVRGIV